MNRDDSALQAPTYPFGHTAVKGPLPLPSGSQAPGPDPVGRGLRVVRFLLTRSGGRQESLFKPWPEAPAVASSEGFEPPAPGFGTRRSLLLSYED